jgi:regulator of ribosome biosynthesis
VFIYTDCIDGEARKQIKSEVLTGWATPVDPEFFLRKEGMSVSAKKSKTVQYMTTEVNRQIPVELDLGNLTAFDINTFVTELPKLNKADREAALLANGREVTQALLNALFALPVTSVPDVGAVVELPKGSTKIPREKPVPKAKELTNWEKFAKAKGIVKRKHGAKEFDEDTKEWTPRYGSKSAKNRDLADWCKEVGPDYNGENDE